MCLRVMGMIVYFLTYQTIQVSDLWMKVINMADEISAPR